MGEQRKVILGRLYFVYLMVCLFGAAIIARIWHLQFVEGDFWRARADSTTTAMRKIEPARGNIYTSDGSLLATSVPIYDLRVDWMTESITQDVFNDNVDSLSICMSRLFLDKTSTEYKRIMREARREHQRFYLLKRNVTYKQLQAVRTFPIFRMGRYKGGLIIEQKSKRIKPFSQLASRTVGYKTDGVEPVGIEGAFDGQLRGMSGMRLMQRISGNVWKPLNDENEIEPKDGNDLITTIDLNIQDVAQSSLLKQLQLHNADKGCAILMEVSTGEIRAIANLKRGEDGNYREEFNFAVGESTEPGSTFKLASVMALMEDGYATPDDSVDTQGGAVRYANRVMKDSHDGGYGRISLQHVFEVSSNVGISKMVHKFYSKNPQAFVDRVKSFGLGKKLDLQIAGEGKPFIKNTDHELWSKVSLPYMSIGYECSVTPLQILTFYNAVANNGRMMKPFFVKEVRNKGHLVKKFEPQVVRDSIASPQTIAWARNMLEGVVQEGTATNLRHAQYMIAGKTGTAQIANARDGYKNGKVRYQASFVGYFPADNPKYSCIVVVYAPNGNLYYAAQVAGPIFKEIADKVYASSIELHRELRHEQLLAMNVPAVKKGTYAQTETVARELKIPMSTAGGNDRWVMASHSKEKVVLKGMNIRHDQVPDVHGMGLRDAVYILESLGMRVQIVGRGQVVSQSVKAGTRISKGMEVILTMDQ